MENVSGSGLVITLVASKTMPTGMQITQFADDADPFDMPSIAIGDKAMGLNGDLVTWRKAVPKDVTINVIPGSDDDVNLQILAQANTPGRGRFPLNDEITMTAVYPSGSVVIAKGGTITNAAPGNSVASSGRLKTKAYVFAFESVLSF